MALYDLRGEIRDRTPETTIGHEWADRLPHGDRFGLQGRFRYQVISIPTAIATGAFETVRAYIPVPRSEIWEVASFRQDIVLLAAKNVDHIEMHCEDRAAAWIINAEWQDFAALDSELLVTAVGTGGNSDRFRQSWGRRQNYVDNLADLFRQTFWPGETIIASFRTGEIANVQAWNIWIDLKRYPSPAEILRRIRDGEVDRDELYANWVAQVHSRPPQNP